MSATIPAEIAAYLGSIQPAPVSSEGTYSGDNPTSLSARVEAAFILLLL